VARPIVRTVAAKCTLAPEACAGLTLQTARQTPYARELEYAVPVLHAEQVAMSAAVLVQWVAGSTGATAQAIVMLFGNGLAHRLATRSLVQVLAARTHVKQVAALMLHAMVSSQVIAVDLAWSVTAVAVA
jgi:hypothetical protein